MRRTEGCMQKRLIGLVAFVIISAGGFSAFAQAPQITSGLSWLYSAQTSTGNWPQASTTDYHSTATAMDAVSSLDPSNPAYGAAFQWLSTQIVSPTDYLSRQIIALARAGQDTSGYLASLFLYRNLDGGFEGADGYPNSYILDTALAIQALKAVNYSDMTLIGQSLNYLIANQHADGGWGLASGGISNANTTATVLKTLSLYNGIFINQSSITNAVNYLLSKQNADGGFGNSPSTVWDTALAFDALVASGANISAIAPSAINYLMSTQLADGSWDEDPYSTAIALRAIASARANLALSSTDISLSKSMPQENESVTITATVHNTGFDSASNVIVRFYLGDPSAGGVQIGSDQIIPSLSVNSSSSVSITQSFTGTGGKTIFVVVDPDNLISETSEADNKSSARVWVATAPDLAVSSEDLTPSTYVPASGTAFTLNYTVRNLGESATAGFDVAVYDGSTSGTPLQTAHISGLNGAEVRTGTFGVTLTGDGAHTLSVVADTGNVITEASKTNNTGSVTVQVGGVQAQADLVVTAADIALTPSRPTANQTVQISALIRNQGIEAANGFLVELYDGAPESGGTLIFSQSMSLASGTDQTITTNWTVSPGIHDVYLVLDRTNLTVETNETNNTASLRVMTDMVDISLSATDLVFTPSHPVNGDAVVLSITAHNTGIQPTGPFNLTLYNGDPNAGGTLLQTYAVTSIPGDGSATVTYTFTASPQTYRFYAIADTENVVAEMYEDNNLAIRSLKIKAPGEVLGPDLVPIKIDLSGSITDPLTLAISGNAQVTFQNKGDNKIELPFNVIVFEDKDNNGVYTSGMDNLLGTSTMVTGPTASIPAIWPEGAGMVSVPLAGTVKFLHSPLYAMIDSGDVILEQDEANNLLVSCKDCEVVPTNPIQPVLKWKWPSGDMPCSGQVTSQPVIAPLIDTSGDGKINEKDDPYILFLTPDRLGCGGGGLASIYAVNGKTGQELFTVHSQENSTALSIMAGAHLAVGDINNDGIPEILVTKYYDGNLLAFKNDGTLLWDNTVQISNWNLAHRWSPSYYVQVGQVAPISISDIDADGLPDIVTGAAAFNGDGSVKWGRPTAFAYGEGTQLADPNSVTVADIDLDGQQEILAGNTVYNADGTVKWWNNNLTDGFSLAVNLNDDPYPEILYGTIVNNGSVIGVRIYLFDYTGQIIWGPVYIHDLEPTAPLWLMWDSFVIADFDGDGETEIGIKGYDNYFLLDRNGVLKNSIPMPWYSSPVITVKNMSSPTVFDLNGDGRPELISNNGVTFKIQDVKTGTVLYQEPFGGSNSNAYSSVIVSDVDNDGHAELVVFGGEGVMTPQNGLSIYRAQNNDWVGSRTIYNELFYHVTNVNDDGSIPQYEAPSWLLNNTHQWQAAVAPASNPYLTPNLTAAYLRAAQNSTGLHFTVRIGNGGAKEALAGVPVTFYDGPSTGSGQAQATGTLLGTALTTRVLQPGEYQDLILGVGSLADGPHHIYAVVNPCSSSSNCSSRISECNYDDNQTELDLTMATGLPDLKVGTEDIAISVSPIAEGSIIPITVTVRNIGLVAASNIEVKLSNGNPASGGAWIGLPQTITNISAGGSAVLTFSFDTLGHAGQNILYVSLDPDSTVVEATRENNIALVSINVQAPTLPNFTITTDGIQTVPANPREGEQVIVTATVTNRGAATGNVPVRIAVRSDELGVGSEVYGETKIIYPILSLGQSATVTAPFDTAGFAGQRSIVVTIDPANLITESDKTDNSASKPIFIQSAGLTSSVLLDKPAYQANENMTATITTSNSTADARSLFLTMAVKDSAGNLIATILSGDAVTLGPNGAVTLTRTWNIGNNLAGSYALTAEVAEGGVVISKANAGFTITADKSASAGVTTDKVSYNLNETAALTSVITSQSANYIQENLSATITVTGAGVQGPGASPLYTETKIITTLMPGAAFTFKSYWNTGVYPAGAYPVLLEVKDSIGALISTGTTTVTITNVISPKTALRGQVSVDKQSLMSGEPVNVSYSVTNIGNVDLPAVTFSVQTVHVVNQTVYDNLASQATLTMGGTYTSSGTIDSTTYSAMDYLVVLRANIGGIEETLAGTYFRVEGAPTVPALIAPAMGVDVDTFTPALTVSNASDPNDDKLTYEFELYSDSGLLDLVTSSGVRSEELGVTSWISSNPLIENHVYYWRSRAYDGKLYGPWMDAASFRVNTINDPPTAPMPLSPADLTSVSVLTPVLTNTNAIDPDSVNLTYNFEVSLNPDFTRIVAQTQGVFESQGTTSYQVSPALSENTWYYWRAQADDWQVKGPWSAPFSFFVNTTNDAPTKPVILLPTSNAVITSLNADIVLQNSTDIDSSVISYSYEVDTVPSFDSGSTIRSGVIPAGQGTTTYQAAGLLDNTLYYVRAIASDDSSAESGWTDAISFFVNTVNDKPSAPVISNPSLGAGVSVFTPTLTVYNATDPDRDQLTYDFEVYADAGLTIQVTGDRGQGTVWTVPVTLTENQTYYWRVRAFDGALYSDWAGAWFVVNTANDAPGAPALYAPLDGATLATFLPTLSVTNAVDPDSDTLTYAFELLNAGVLVATQSGVRSEESGVTSWTVISALNDNTTYQWRARAFDGDRYGPWMNMATFTVHVQQTGLNVEIEVEPETLNQKSHGNWVMVEIELPHGYHASDVDISSIRLEGVVPVETRPYNHYKHHDNGCEHDHAEHEHDELKVKFDRSAVLAVLPNGNHVPVHVTGRIGSATFEGVDFIKVIH